MASSMPSRPYDALYDPTFTVSGARDHYRQQGSSGFLIEKVPEHANLFSELQHHPTSTFRLAANDKVPAFVDRSFHPQQRQPEQLQQQSLAQQVNGRQQYKYFRRPQLPPGVRLSAPLHLTQQQPAVPEPPAPPEPAIKDAYTQSDYRESEAQTLPWSPDWVLPRDPAVLAKQAVLSAKFNCQGPEVLQLADLKFGDGLPGGLQEVQRLEKLRQKRAFEASLPPIDDAARLPERQALIEAWEAAEWAEREGEIQGVQEERLSLLQAALKVREEEIEEAHRAQVEQRSAALLAAKAHKFAAIHSSRIKTIRQLAARRKAVDAAARGSSGSGSSIIDKYADYGSPVYAPLQREGRFPDAIKPSAAAGSAGMPAGNAAGAAAREVPDIASLAPSSLAGLQELQASLPARALQPKLHRPKPPAKLNYSQRAEAAVQQDVETISNLLQSAKATQGRGVGQVWPYPIDHGALDGSCGAGSGGRLGSGKRSVGVAAALGSLGDSAAQQQQVVAGGKGGTSGSKVPIATRTGERPPTPDAPPLPDADGQHAALVLLQRLLRGRAVQNEMYAGKTARLQLVRELRLGLEGTAGCQPRPEVRDAATQELDAAIGSAVCRVCCLLASDDEAAITQLLLGVAERRQQKQQLQEQLDPQWLTLADQPEEQQQLDQPDVMPGSGEQLQQQSGDAPVSQQQQQLHELSVIAADAVAQQDTASHFEQQLVQGNSQEGELQQQQLQQSTGQEEGQSQQAQQVLQPLADEHETQLSGDELVHSQQDSGAAAAVPTAEDASCHSEAGNAGVQQQQQQQQQHSKGDEEGTGDYRHGDGATDVAAAAESGSAADAVAADAEHITSSSSSRTAEGLALQQQSMGLSDQGEEVAVMSAAGQDSAENAVQVSSNSLPASAEPSAAAPESVQPPAAAGSWSAGEQVVAEGSVGSDAVAGRAAEASLAGGVLLAGGGVGVPADASYSGSGGHGSGAVSGVGSQFSLGAGVHVDEQESEDAARTPSMLKPRGLHAIIGGEGSEGHESAAQMQEEQQAEMQQALEGDIDMQQEHEADAQREAREGMQQEASSHSSSSSSSSSSISGSEGEEQ